MDEYNVELFKEIMDADIKWRNDQFLYLKQNATINNITESRLEVIIKYAPVTIYALFEGFVNEITKNYLHIINEIQYPISAYQPSVINRELEVKYKYHQPNTDVKKREDLATNLQDYFSSPTVKLSEDVDTQSNVKLKVLNGILRVYNIQQFEESYVLADNVKINDFLNKLLRFRNSLAHGEATIKVTIDDIEYFTKNLSALFFEMETRYEKSLSDKTFLVLQSQ